MTDERRPPFAADFPRVPELDALVDAFSRGDFARVRAGAPSLAASAQDEAVRAASRTLLHHTKPDPLAVALVAIAGALLVALAAYWTVNGKAPRGSAPKPPPIERVR